MVKTVMVDWDLFSRRRLLSDRPKKKACVKAFIQARITSSRFPGKIYETINGAPLLYHTINAAKEAKLIDETIVISPHHIDTPEGINNFVFDGREENVLSRYLHALRQNPCDYVVRLTSDCPLLDPNLIDFIVAAGIGHDYASNVLTATFPDGTDCEIISTPTMHYLDEHADSDYDREHVTTLIRSDPYTQTKLDLVSVQALKDQSFIKISVDTPDDLKRVRDMEEKLKCLR